MATLTGLGDAAVTIPAACILFASFLLTSRGVALRWLCAVALCGLVTAAGKIAIYAYGQPVAMIHLTSPSGHAAASVLIYGGLASAMGGARRRVLPFVLAVLTVLLIAISRVYLRDHTEADVVLGIAIGGACLVWFMPNRVAGYAWPVRMGAAICLTVCLVGTAMGWRLPLDPWLRAAADHLVASAAAAPNLAAR